MSQVFEGALDARGLKFALVVARFNELFTEQLLAGAFDCLRRHGAAPADLHVVRVPGSFEVPLAAKTAAETGRYDAVVCIAAVVRGATPHFDLVANAVAQGVAQACLATGVPMTFGVLTADTLEQAVERSGTKQGNKGWDAAQAAIETANVLRQLRGAGAAEVVPERRGGAPRVEPSSKSGARARRARTTGGAA